MDSAGVSLESGGDGEAVGAWTIRLRSEISSSSSFWSHEVRDSNKETSNSIFFTLFPLVKICNKINTLQIDSL